MQVTDITVTLDNVSPTVRRSLVVPAAIPLDRLHRVLQAAFGWQDSHLYRFAAGAPYALGGARWGMPGFDDEPDEIPADTVTLAAAAATAGSAGLTYLYDFGDDWIHRIDIGETRVVAPGEIVPRLTALTGTCPPEDVGGPPGYAEFVAAMADPRHRDHAQLKRWHGGRFDPAAPPETRLRAAVAALAEPATKDQQG